MLNVMPGSTPYQQYKKNAVETATPEKLLLMLFDGAIKFINQAIIAINEKNFDTSNQLLLKVQDIFDELIFSLDTDKGGEIALNLNNLYVFYRSEVVEANILKDSPKLEPVIEFMQLYRSVWSEAAKLAKTGIKNAE